MRARMYQFLRQKWDGLQQYGIEITSLPDDVLDDLRCCLGTRIVETSLPHYHDGMVPSIFDLIKDIKLEKLEMFADLNSAKVGWAIISNFSWIISHSRNGLLKQLRENRVDELFLTVREVKLANPCECLHWLPVSQWKRRIYLMYPTASCCELFIRSMVSIGISIQSSQNFCSQPPFSLISQRSFALCSSRSFASLTKISISGTS